MCFPNSLCPGHGPGWQMSSCPTGPVRAHSTRPHVAAPCQSPVPGSVVPGPEEGLWSPEGVPWGQALVSEPPHTLLKIRERRDCAPDTFIPPSKLGVQTVSVFTEAENSGGRRNGRSLVTPQPWKTPQITSQPGPGRLRRGHPESGALCCWDAPGRTAMGLVGRGGSSDGILIIQAASERQALRATAGSLSGAQIPAPTGKAVSSHARLGDWPLLAAGALGPF